MILDILNYFSVGNCLNESEVEQAILLSFRCTLQCVQQKLPCCYRNDSILPIMIWETRHVAFEQDPYADNTSGRCCRWKEDFASLNSSEWTRAQVIEQKKCADGF